MPSYLRTRADCDRRNRDRMVDEVGAYSMRRFWRQAHGAYMIAGGTGLARQGALLGRMTAMAEEDRTPIIVVSADAGLAPRMIDWARDHPVQLMVTSPAYPNYHFFFGTDSENIINCLLGIAQMQGCQQTAELESYARAFLAVLKAYYKPSLPSMRELALRSDPRIAALGMQKGVPPLTVNVLRTQTQAGQIFRNLLTSLSESFSGLSSAAPESKNNITVTVVRGAQSERPLVHLMDVSAVNPSVMNHYLAAELKNLLLHRAPFRLLLDGLRLGERDPMKAVIDLALGSGSCDLGICAGNPWLMLNEDREIRGFHAIMLLISGSDMDPLGLERLLDQFGSYQHWEPVMAGPDRFFQLFHRDYTIQPMPRKRVRLEDVRTGGAVLFGATGNRVVIARQLTN